MWELDCEEGWAPKNWCFWSVVLEKTLESPLDCKKIQPVHSEGDQPWDFFGRNDAKAETPVLWPPREELTHWKRLWCWEGLGAREEGDDTGWDGSMASLTRWTWVWVNFGSWWWTGMAWHAAIHAVAKSWTRLNDWSDLIWFNLNVAHQALIPACLSSFSSGSLYFVLSTLIISFIEDTGLTDIRDFWQKVLWNCFSLKTFAHRLFSSRLSLRLTFSDLSLSLTQNCFFI